MKFENKPKQKKHAMRVKSTAWKKRRGRTLKLHVSTIPQAPAFTEDK